MWKLIFAFMLGSALFIAVPINAADVYVDNRSSCPGNGSSSTPYCSIQNALNNAAAGQNIKIRTGTGIYNEQAFVSGKNGTAASPIVLERDAGANFIIRNTLSPGAFAAAITIRESDYWIVRNLVFDGGSLTNLSMVALHAQCEAKNCVGWVLSGNTFKNWKQATSGPTNCSGLRCGPELVQFAGCNTQIAGGCGGVERRITGVLENNSWQNNDGHAIQLLSTQNTHFRNNRITGQGCGLGSDGSVNKVGVHITWSNPGLRIYDNTFSDFVPVANCTVANPGNFMTSAATWSDVCTLGTEDTEIYRNTVFNIDQGNHTYNGVLGAGGHQSHGFFVEAGCAAYTVHHNIIYNIGNEGITFSFHSLNSAQTPNQAYNNTIFNVMNGFFAKEGKMILKNNIVKNASDAAICVGCGSGSPSLVALTSDYNLYDDGGSQTKIGIKNGTTYDLSNWRTQCNCDTKSIANNPLFISLTTADFNLQSGSPARGAGEGGVDIGAYPYTGSLLAAPTAPNNLQITTY